MPEGTKDRPAPAAGEAPRKPRARWALRFVLAILLIAAANVALFAWIRARDPKRRLAKLDEEARLYMRIGRHDEAARLLAEAEALAPGQPEVAVALANELDASGHPDDAFTTLERAEARMPRNALVSAALGRALLARGDAKRADALLEPLVDRLRAIPDAKARVASLVVAARAAADVGALARAQSILADAATGDERAPALAALAQILLRAGKLDAAEKALRDARAAAPDDAGIVIALARILELRGRPDDTVRELEALVRGGGERRLSAVGPLADILCGTGRLPEAHALADELAKDPRALAAAAYVRGAIAQAERDEPTAEAEFTRMAELMPRSARPRILAARAALRRGAPDRARAGFEAALVAEPGLAEAELGLLDLDEREGATEAVRRRAEALIERPATRASAVRALVASYARESDIPAGLARIEALRARFPDDATLRAHEAVFRILAGDVERGAADLSRLAEEDPELPGAFSLVANVEEGRAGALDAIGRLEALAGKGARFAAARVALARIYERIGRPDLALREVDAALKDRPDLREAIVARARLALIAKDLPGALAAMQRLEATDAALPPLIAAAADLEHGRGDAAGAVKLLERARELAPRSAPVAARLARARALAGDGDGAVAGWRAARALDPKLPEAYDDGALLLARGDVAGARPLLAEALAATSAPRFAAALAAATALAGEPARALEPLATWRSRTATTEAPLFEAAFSALAGDPRHAADAAAIAPAPPEVRAAVVALRAEPTGAVDARARTLLEIFALGALGWTPELRERVERVARDPAADALLTFVALRGLAADGAPAPKIRVPLARRLFALAPAEPTPGLELADALAEAGDADGELATLEGIRARFPDSSGVALRLGMALERRGDEAGALALYAVAAGAPQPLPVALNNLAYLLSRDPARRPLAVAHARRAASLAPQNGDILDTLGWVLLLDGQLDEAATVLARASELAPASATIRFHLAVALDSEDETRRAADQLEVALLSSAPFPEQAEARALLERLRAELALAAAPPTPGAPALAPGGEAVEAAPGADGLAVLQIPAAPGAREVALRFRAPADAPGFAMIAAEGRTWKRVEAGPGEEVFIPRLSLAPAGHRVLLRTSPASAKAGGRFRIALEAAAPPAGEPWELEPDDAVAAALVLAPGGSLAGALDGPGDRDCVRLDIATGRRAAATVAAGARGELRLELLATRGSRERVARVARVRAGETVTLAGLVGRGDQALVLRIGAGSALAPAGAAPARDWRVALADDAGAGDPEPNDRPEDAVAIGPGERAAGGLGPGDAIDWYRVTATAGEVLAIGARDVAARPAGAASPVQLELWARAQGGRMLPLRRYSAIGAGVALPRWRTPREGELFIALGVADGAGAASYELSVERAPAVDGSVETEPNDAPAVADVASAGVAFRGALDAAGDRDWVRVPPLPAGAALALELHAAPDFQGATVAVFASPDRDPRLVATFDAAGGALVVPALRLPDGPVAVVIAAQRSAPGAYELTLAAATSTAGIEVEPDDAPASPIALPPGQSLRGRISGRTDRDGFAVDGRRALVVRATGLAPVAVQVRGAIGAPQVVAPGAEVRLAADALGGGPAVVDLFAPRGEGPTGIAASVAEARAGATYEIASEGGP